MNTDGDGAFDSDAGSGSLQDVFHAELLGCLAGMKEAARMGLPGDWRNHGEGSD